MHDRRDVLRGTCDKAVMKRYAGRAAGDLVRIPATVWAGTDVRDLATVDLPGHWVLKPTHRTHLVAFGTGRPDIPELADRVRRDVWLDEVQWSVLGEWAYGQATPGLLVEELIGEPGSPPEDCKFFARLGAPFDFMRIDLYAVGDTVWLGGTTPYPGAGLETSEPRDLDLQLGDWWRLPDVDR